MEILKPYVFERLFLQDVKKRRGRSVREEEFLSAFNPRVQPGNLGNKFVVKAFFRLYERGVETSDGLNETGLIEKHRRRQAKHSGKNQERQNEKQIDASSAYRVRDGKRATGLFGNEGCLNLNCHTLFKLYKTQTAQYPNKVPNCSKHKLIFPFGFFCAVFCLVFGVLCFALLFFIVAYFCKEHIPLSAILQLPERDAERNGEFRPCLFEHVF